MPKICDSCLDCGYDEGAPEDALYQIMVELGADMPDHYCDSVDYDTDCDCGCKIYRN